MTKLSYSERAADWLRDAEPDVQDQVLKRLEQAVDFPDHFLKPMSGTPYHILRAGDYRAIIDRRRDQEDEDELFVREIGHRDGIYD